MAMAWGASPAESLGVPDGATGSPAPSSEASPRGGRFCDAEQHFRSNLLNGLLRDEAEEDELPTPSSPHQNWAVEPGLAPKADDGSQGWLVPASPQASWNLVPGFDCWPGPECQVEWFANSWEPLPALQEGNGVHAPWGRSDRRKRRFCTTYPDVSTCRRGQECAFAHTREEVGVPLLEPEEEQQQPFAMTDDFFMHKYKTRWCPMGVQHEWHWCVYAHNYQDARRPPSIGYGVRLCPHWSRKDTGAGYFQRCPWGLKCPFSHGAKEQLYHPHYFKMVTCRDVRGGSCPRRGLCAFYHSRGERRAVQGQDGTPCPVVPPAEDVNYSAPLPEESLPEDWVADFLSPPFLPEGSRTPVAACGGSQLLDFGCDGELFDGAAHHRAGAHGFNGNLRNGGGGTGANGWSDGLLHGDLGSSPAPPYVIFVSPQQAPPPPYAAPSQRNWSTPWAKGNGGKGSFLK